MSTNGNNSASATTPSSLTTDHFSIRRCPPVSTVVLFITYVCFKELPVIADGLPQLDNHLGDSDGIGNLALVQVVMQMIGVLCTICHTLIRIKKEIKKEDPIFEPLDRSHCLQLGVCIAFAAASILSLFYTVVEMRDQSENTLLEDFLGTAHVNFLSLGNRIIYDSYTVIITPLLLSAIYNDALRDIFGIWWAACVLALVVSIALVNDLAYGLITCFFFGQTFLLFYAMQHNVWMMYFKEELRHRQQQEEIVRHDGNMKLMLANAAHDLKTVSRSSVRYIRFRIASS